jgi:hypothetical protein
MYQKGYISYAGNPLKGFPCIQKTHTNRTLKGAVKLQEFFDVLFNLF